MFGKLRGCSKITSETLHVAKSGKFCRFFDYSIFTFLSKIKYTLCQFIFATPSLVPSKQSCVSSFSFKSTRRSLRNTIFLQFFFCCLQEKMYDMVSIRYKKLSRKSKSVQIAAAKRNSFYTQVDTYLCICIFWIWHTGWPRPWWWWQLRPRPRPPRTMALDKRVFWSGNTRIPSTSLKELLSRTKKEKNDQQPDAFVAQWKTLA